MKPILCLDFDGVIHSYTSGWKGPRVIPDPPVPGALEFIAAAVERFDVQILSSRSHAWFGRRAMRRWIIRQYASMAPSWGATPKWLQRIIARDAFADPWEDEARWSVRGIVARIGFPLHKPAAKVTIDDRALCFTGAWPSLDELARFKPWKCCA